MHALQGPSVSLEQGKCMQMADKVGWEHSTTSVSTLTAAVCTLTVKLGGLLVLTRVAWSSVNWSHGLTHP